MWEKLKAWCAHSATIALAYIGFAVSTFLENVDNLSNVLNDQSINQKIATVLHANPKVLGIYGMAASVAFAVARARSLVKKP